VYVREEESVRGSIWQLEDERRRIRWYAAEGTRRQSTFRQKREAERELARRLNEAEQGVQPLNSKTRLGEFLGEWEEATKNSLKPRSWEVYDLHVRRYIKPRLGRAPLVSLDARAVQRFVDGLSRSGLSPRTVRGVHGTLSVILTAAVGYGVARPIPRGIVRLPRIPVRRMLVPTPAQVEAIAARIDARLYALVILCAYAGLRQGEALALRPGDIDWLRRRIHVNGSINQRTRARESTKTDHDRWVTLPSRVAEVLSEHVAEYPSSEWVFHRADGGPWKASRVHESWDIARGAVKGCENLRFHDLRHAAVSLWISAAWSVKRVQEEAGHADPAMTLRVYAHLWPSELEQGRTQLDAAITAALGRLPDAETGSTGVAPMVEPSS
jgi:integrase